LSTTETSRRPGTVTTVVVLTVLAGVMDLIGGASLWAFAGNSDLQDLTDSSKGTIVTLAIVTIVIGLATIAVGLMLGGGSNGARILVTILMVLRIAAGIWAMMAAGTNHLGEGLITIVIAVVVLGLLWNAKANEYFS
jgi:hypothetical protein